jgi:hypothetical protein
MGLANKGTHVQQNGEVPSLSVDLETGFVVFLLSEG